MPECCSRKSTGDEHCSTDVSRVASSPSSSQPPSPLGGAEGSIGSLSMVAPVIVYDGSCFRRAKEAENSKCANFLIGRILAFHTPHGVSGFSTRFRNQAQRTSRRGVHAVETGPRGSIRLLCDHILVRISRTGSKSWSNSLWVCRPV